MRGRGRRATGSWATSFGVRNKVRRGLQTWESPTRELPECDLILINWHIVVPEDPTDLAQHNIGGK